MSTANFKTPNLKLPLVTNGLDMEDGEAECVLEEARVLVDDFNTKLKHFEVVLVSGYYEGFMLDAVQVDDYIDYEDISTLTDDEAEYFYGAGYTADGIRKEMQAEYDSIVKFFDDYVNEWGGLKLQRVATFSNGEAVYRKI